MMALWQSIGWWIHDNPHIVILAFILAQQVLISTLDARTRKLRKQMKALRDEIETLDD